ncbi:MAG: hypothetical protein HKN73_06595 [Gemmatimonadetes bacterium]|nr:hypothetical protein [Gemmatimonadota bacterium]
MSGRAQTKNRANGNQLKADIECVNFFGASQNRAWMIGTITHTNRASFPVGATIGFAVADNGEGSDSDPDQITGFGLSDPATTALICSGGGDALLDFFFDNVFGFEAVAGNIQVQAP